MQAEIWIIEDTPMVVRALSTQLSAKFKDAAIRAIIGRDGRDALRQFRRAKIHPEAILIVDGLNGYHREVLAEHSGASVVYTGDPSTIDAPEGVHVYAKAGEEGALFDYLSKVVESRQEDIDLERSAIQDLIRYLRTVPPAVSGTDDFHIDVLRGLL